jgi:L-lactate dehydrogenase complex protein LldG
MNMGIREDILDRVRRNQPPVVSRPEVPDFCRPGQADFIKMFTQGLQLMAGTLVESPPKDFDAFLRAQFPSAKTVCSAVAEYTGDTKPEDYLDWSDAGSIDVSVVRSPMGIAETGSVLLSEEDLHVNTIGFLAHDIVVLLDPERIVENVHAAYAHPAFRERAYAVLMTGPSGSADIGGKEVHPAQGVMTLTVILWPEQAKDNAANAQTGRFANPGRT